MAEEANDRSSEDAKAVGDGGMKVGETDQQEKDACVNQGDPTVDKVTFEIFLPAIASGMEYNIFVAEEGVSQGDDCRGDDEHEVVDARIQ